MVDSPRSYGSWDDRDGAGSDDWSSGRPDRAYTRPGRDEPRFEQRLDQWVSAGRQLVDGVSGARPGSRAASRGGQARAGSRLRPGDLGRWVETKLDWLLEDDDGWREPWQEPPVRRTAAPAERPVRAAASPRRQPLEAISRRGGGLPPVGSGPAASPAADAADQEWPDDTSFSVNRWRRGSAAEASDRDRRGPDPSVAVPPPVRAVPRSSRRRLD